MQIFRVIFLFNHSFVTPYLLSLGYLNSDFALQFNLEINMHVQYTHTHTHTHTYTHTHVRTHTISWREYLLFNKWRWTCNDDIHKAYSFPFPQNFTASIRTKIKSASKPFMQQETYGLGFNILIPSISLLISLFYATSF